jgi:4-amino-4-deoxy-L-arabinose transferase-like glycosyltransferase
VAAVVFGLYFQAQPHWLADPDAQDYAQLGRQIAAGRGPSTRYMPWNGLDFLAERDAGSLVGESPSWPNIVRFPLTPVLMALGFAVAGPADEAAHLPAGLSFILTAGCAALLGARTYGAWAGLTAGLAVTFLPLLVNYSLTGLTESLLGLQVLAVLACVARGRENLSLGGVLFGLAVLNRYDTALLALPILALWLLARPGWFRRCTAFLVPAGIVVLPWAVYLTVVAGTPLFNLQPASIAAQASGRADGLGWYLPEYVAPGEVWSQNPARALRIVWIELADTPNHLRKLLGWPWLAAGGAACLLPLSRARGMMSARRAALPRSPLDSGAARPRGPFPVAQPIVAPRSGLGGGGRLVAFLLVAVLLRAALASTLGLNLQRHFVPLVPLLLVIVSGEVIWLARALVGRLVPRGGLRPAVLHGVSALVALALVVPSASIIGPFLRPPSEPPGPPRGTGEVEARPENLIRVAALVGPEQLVASNVPWSVAWQADRRAVPLPPTVEATADLERRYGIGIDAIYVAGQVAIADAPRSWRAWDDLRRRGTTPPGYVLAESFQNGGRLFVKAR